MIDNLDEDSIGSDHMPWMLDVITNQQSQPKDKPKVKFIDLMTLKNYDKESEFKYAKIVYNETYNNLKINFYNEPNFRTKTNVVYLTVDRIDVTPCIRIQQSVCVILKREFDRIDNFPEKYVKILNEEFVIEQPNKRSTYTLDTTTFLLFDSKNKQIDVYFVYQDKQKQKLFTFKDSDETGYSYSFIQRCVENIYNRVVSYTDI